MIKKFYRDETKRSNTSLFSKIKVPKVPVEKIKKLGKIKRKSMKGSEITEIDVNENDIGNKDTNTIEEGCFFFNYLLQVTFTKNKRFNFTIKSLYIFR